VKHAGTALEVQIEEMDSEGVVVIFVVSVVTKYYYPYYSLPPLPHPSPHAVLAEV